MQTGTSKWRVIMPKSIPDTGKFEVSIVEIGRRRTLQPGIFSMDLGICDIVCCIDSLKVAVVQREYD